jgi:hypothetical protein
MVRTSLPVENGDLFLDAGSTNPVVITNAVAKLHALNLPQLRGGSRG